MSAPRKKFGVTKVSADVHRMISSLENAAMKVAAAGTLADVEEAYSLLCYNRKFLYEYLEDELVIPEGTPVTYLRFT